MALLSLFFSPQTLTLRPQNPSTGRHLASSLPRRSPPPRHLRLRCSSADHGGGWRTPRPAEISWSKALCNSVRLIGTVGSDPQLRQLPSGSCVAWTSIAVWKSATGSTWVSLTFWDELALMASEHVKKGQRIFVSGRLVSDTVDDGTEKRRVYYKVVVQQLNLIEPFQQVQLYQPGSSLDTTSGEKRVGYGSSSSGSTEELWQAFFANPLDWWDNRRTKTNPKYPDFKHKHTGEALWVDGMSNPQWVTSQLAVLDSRMGSLQDSERKPVSFMFADEFMALDASS